MATIVDVAQRAGVGTTTVTKVLANRPHVSAPTRQRVLEAIADLDYHPSAVGRTLRTGITHVLGVITPAPSADPLSHVFFTRVLAGVAACASEYGYDVLWLTAASHREPESKGSYAALFKSKRVDGLIDVNIYLNDPRIEALRVSGYPFVLIGHPEDESLPHVDSANWEAGASVGRAFVARHYTAVAFIGMAESPAAHDRLHGFVASLAATKISLPDEHIALLSGEGGEENLEALGWVTMNRWIASGQLPRAVFAATDELAYGVLRACREAGYRIPDDVALVGFDDDPLSRFLDPPLATVQQQIHELGYHAAHLLVRILAGEAFESRRYTLPTYLIERTSIGPLAHTAGEKGEKAREVTGKDG